MKNGIEYALDRFQNAIVKGNFSFRLIFCYKKLDKQSRFDPNVLKKVKSGRLVHMVLIHGTARPVLTPAGRILQT